MQKKILIIEDEPTISRIVSNYFSREGYLTQSAFNGVDGIDLVKSFEPDIVLLDIMLPLKDGWQVAKEIRDFSKIPIIVMTALSSEEDILKGYSLLVDDYIVKPFNPKVLIAKVNNMLSRITTTKNDNENLLKAGDIIVDLDAYKVFIKNQEIKMSKTEFDLLLYFINHEGKICERKKLINDLWKDNPSIDDRIVDTYVKNLRKYLKGYNYIKTVFGIGYRFETK